MCGIVGFISKGDKVHPVAKQHFMHYGLIIDTLRGRDSTGVIRVTSEFDVSTRKSLLPGYRYVTSKSYQNNWVDAWAMVGHNRAATIGKVTLPNAHPFTFGPVSLVHNGTLYNDGYSLPTYKKGLDVDSMQIAHALAQHKPEEAAEVLSHVSGAFALVWTDYRDQSINIVRNHDRPFHFAKNHMKNIMWFMSDHLHLHTLMNSMKGDSARGQTVYSLDKYKLLKFKKGSLVPEVTTVVPFSQRYKSQNQVTHQASRFRQDGQNKYQKHLRESQKNAQEKKDDKDGTAGKSGQERSDITLLEMKINVAGQDRKLLAKHVGLIRQIYDLSPKMVLRFSPEHKIKMKNDRYWVTGTMYVPSWECWWDCTVPNVPEVIVNAYWEHHWLVNPTGVGHAIEESQAPVPSIMAQYFKAVLSVKKDEAQAAPKVESPKQDDNTYTVSGKRFDKNYVRRMMEHGCIQCQFQLDEEDLGRAVLVNDGRDLLCGDCVDEVNKRAATKASNMRSRSNLH